MPWRLTSIEKAIQESLKYLDHVPSVVEVTIENSVGCVAAEEIRAIMDLPPYHRSAVDGFAVRAEDTIGASPWNPIPLKLKGCIDVGTIPTSSLSSGECMEISTGAPLPEGANAVVMIENSSAKGSIVEVFKGVAVWENVSR
ncbi:MAG: molybdopterin molybdenumtransferase MoeA, partial [Thermoprotei archaeon]